MHLPGSFGEWVTMAVLMALVMVAGMALAHRLRSHLRGTDRAMEPGMVMHIGTRVIGWLLGLGVPVTILGPMRLLTVTGRRSGRRRTVPVDVHEVDGRRYLLATHGVGAWVLNLRAAGGGTLRRGHVATPFVTRELTPEEAAPVMRAALGRLLASPGWRGRGLRANLGLTAAATDEDFVSAARTHPAFEVVAEASIADA